MSGRLQNVLLFLLAAVLVGGTALAIKYSTGYRPLAGFGPSGPPLPGDIALRFSQVRVVGRKDNRRAWRVTADQVDTTKAKTRVDFHGNITAELLNEKEKQRAVVTAPQASYDVPRQLLTANGKLLCLIHPVSGAVGPQAKGDLKVETDSLVWNVGAKSVLCSNTVTATMPDAHISGKMFSVNLETREFSLANVQADFVIEENREPGTLGEGYLP